MHPRYRVVMLMYDEMAAMGVLVAFVEIDEGGDGEGSSGSGEAGEVVGEV